MIGKLYIITGPSGVGKTSVAMELLKRRPTLKKVVTCTTRKIREGEIDGVSYHFLNRENFQRLIDQGAMFEWDEHYDNLYGSRRSDVEALMEAGNDVLFVVDVAGAKTIKEANPHAILLFIEAESVDQLMERIARRDKGTTAGLDERKVAIQREMAFTSYADHRIVNRENELEKTIDQIQTLMDT
ncbi:guanylate kinase [Candidatus Uhrbacteria bacterium]|nr:guanylate kinase [Candidatus Uhrbacteria bacterium]